MKKFDVIIATYKRPESLERLVSDILACHLLPEKIFVIDSSPDENRSIQTLSRVVYLRSSHGNQPYQRYLGYLSSTAEILVFFDDDMVIQENDPFSKIIGLYEDENVAAVQPNFIMETGFLNAQLPKGKILAFGNVPKFLKRMTGHYRPGEGQFSYCGLRGPKPSNLGTVNYFEGGVFSCKKEAIFQNFNFRLFDLFEKRIGMGEDGILGFGVSRTGKIVYLAESMFLHDDQKDSTYRVNVSGYGKRVAYSRLYLSFEYARLSTTSRFVAFMHFNWFAIWRLLGMIVSQLLHYQSSRTQLFKGYLSGYLKALGEAKTLVTFDRGEYWENEARHDLGK